MKSTPVVAVGLRLMTTLLLATGLSASTVATGPKSDFQISGTVLSTRDGTPVSFCVIAATVSAGSGSGLGIAQSTPEPPVASTRFARTGPGSVSGPSSGQARAGRPRSPGTAQRSADTTSETRADASGHFVLTLPHGGSWRLTAAARGFRSQAYEEHEGYYSSIVLTNTDQAYQANFLLVPDSLISGLVLDEAGEPVASAQIVAEIIPPLIPGENRVSDAGQPHFVANAQSDDRGHYELPFLAPGEYRLRVQAQPWYANGARGGPRMGAPLVSIAGAPGNRVAPPPAASSPDPSLDVVYPVTWYPASDSQAAAETIRLADGEQRQADFHLTAIPASHLLVPRPEAEQPEPTGGRPRPLRPVTITRVSSDGSFGQTSFIGGNGREWDFGGLAPGAYEVRLPGPRGDQDGETRQVEVRPGAGGVVTLENSKALTRVLLRVDGLSDSENTSVEFTDIETGRRILASPSPRGRRGRAGDETDGDEDVSPAPRSVMLPPHRYQIMVAGRSGAYVAGISGTGVKVLGLTVEIGEGSSAALTLHLASNRGEIAGTATMNGHPVCGALVLLVPATLGQPGATASLLRDQTNSDGSFLLEAIVPGRYILAAIDHGWSINFRDAATLAKYLSHGVPLEVKGSGKLHKEIVAVAP